MLLLLLQALSRLVDYMRRAGRLEDVPRLFAMCERTLGDTRANSDAGYHYCKGISSTSTSLPHTSTVLRSLCSNLRPLWLLYVMYMLYASCVE